MSKKKAQFAVHEKDGEDRFYVRLNCITETLVAMIDGLPITFFGKGKTAYLDIDTALSWTKKENTLNPARLKHHKHTLPALIRAKHKFLTGQLIEQ